MRASACATVLAVLALAVAGAFLASDGSSPYVDATDIDDRVEGGIVWSLHGGVLTLSPIADSATMNHYAYGAAPWYEYRSEITSATIGPGIKNIGDWAFYNCNYLSSVSIPGSVTAIGIGAFSQTSLSSVSIPGSVMSISGWAFYNCHYLSSVSIPGSVTAIGTGAFGYCVALSSVVISQGVTAIGEGAFSYCRSLSSVSIPGSVTAIGIGAFAYCSGLTSATVMGSNVSWNDSNVFQGSSSLAAISIHNPHALDNVPSGTLYHISYSPSPGMIVVYYNTAQPLYATQTAGAVTLSGFDYAVKIGTSAWDDGVATVLSGESFAAADLGAGRTAYASLVSHTVAASADFNGAITPSGDVLVAEGGDLTFAFSANAGYAIKSVSINGSKTSDEALAALAAGAHTFEDVQEDGYTIAVETTRLQFSVTASADSNSAITPAGSVGVARGASASFTFSASAGYAISDVVVDGASVPSAAAAGKYTFSGVDSNHTISVKSAPSASSPAGSGSGSGSGDGASDSRDAGGGGDDDGVSVAVILAVVVIAIAVGSAVLWVVLGRR
ncbi:MAG: leucine-rich repeat domain-containing protein [Candidatus Methanoplasma sp.]|jgi:hypothetical protein|nr:leucine-rich repeat domain-containing protein [Candidatus Methanoplasma sp.]